MSIKSSLIREPAGVSVRLRDRRRLCRVGVGYGSVRRHVKGERRVNGRRYVGVEQRHRRSLGKLLARELGEFFAREGLISLRWPLGHRGFPRESAELPWLNVVSCAAFAYATAL